MIHLTLEERALLYAFNGHKGQYRKYTKEPYIVHCISVADIVKSVSSDEELIASAYLHDLVEDTDCSLQDIENHFGERVMNFVKDMTDVSKLSDGNRLVRKEIDRLRLSKVSPKGQTLKLADLLHNTESITNYDKNFARIYMKEKKSLIEVLDKGNPALLARAKKRVEEYENKHNKGSLNE